jgi:hypothetical protein
MEIRNEYITMGPNGREKHGLNFSPYLRSSLSLYRQRRELGQIGWGQTATDVTGSHARAIDSSVVHPGEKKISGGISV